jgi:hypothetical protein
MTPYSREELENDWEFKIIRSQTGAFRNQAALQKLMEEEARAGWQMVEKFDNSRVRFKRPRSARQRDANCPPRSTRTACTMAYPKALLSPPSYW